MEKDNSDSEEPLIEATSEDFDTDNSVAEDTKLLSGHATEKKIGTSVDVIQVHRHSYGTVSQPEASSIGYHSRSLTNPTANSSTARRTHPITLRNPSDEIVCIDMCMNLCTLCCCCFAVANALSY